MDTKQFLTELYENAEGYISLWEKSTKKTCFIDVSKIDIIIDTAMSIETDVYFGVCLGSAPNAIGRFVTEDITVVPGLYFDLDIAGDGHKKTNLPANQEQALEFIDSLPIEPTIIVNSGGGLHVYYLFKEPWILDTPEERLQAQSISKGWQDYIRSRTKWNIDSTHDLPRVLRLPGTINGKGEPVEVKVISHNNNRYDPSEFDNYAVTIITAEKRDKFKRNPSDGPAADVINNCSFIQACRDYAAELSEPQWLAMLSNISRCSDGVAVAHELSRPYAGYSESETNDKIYHVLNDMHPQTCQYIQSALGFGMCPDGGCGVKSPCGFALKKKSVAVDVPIADDKPIPDGFFETETTSTGISKFTDLGNAEYFAQYYKGKIKYCTQMDKWLIWDGCRWIVDGANKITVLAGKCIRSMYDYLSKIPDDDLKKKIFNHAMKSEDARKLTAMIKLAKGYMPVSMDELDQNKWLLNSSSGIIDLKTGKLMPHDPDENMTKIISGKYDPAATCPTFEKFMLDIYGGNKNLVEFTQRFLGYCCTGITNEQQFVIAYGSGRNGKGTLLNLVAKILHDYAKQTPTDVLYSKKNEKGTNDVARLTGARFVLASEGEKGKKFDEALIKKMTGQDVLAARFLYKETFEFMPEFKLCLMTNYKPVASEDDAALWARIQLVPFTQKFEGAKQDKNLASKLSAEIPGIIQWLIRGCLEWQRIGLQPPQEVLLATQEYRNENDKLQDWMEECCSIGEKQIESPKALYKCFQSWSLENGEKFIMIYKNFVKSLEAKGFRQFTGTGNYMKMRGIALVARIGQRESPY